MRYQGGVFIVDVDPPRLRHDDLRDEDIPRSGEALEVANVVFRPVGKMIAAAYKDGTVRLMNAQNGRQRDVFRVVSPPKPILQVAYSPECRHLAAVVDGAVHIIRLPAPGPEDEAAADRGGKEP
jgi:hypothetical protein